jgi:hypothetical protein
VRRSRVDAKLSEFGVAKLLATAEKEWEIVAQPYEAISTLPASRLLRRHLDYHEGAFNHGPRTGGPRKGRFSQRREAGGTAVHRALLKPPFFGHHRVPSGMLHFPGDRLAIEVSELNADCRDHRQITVSEEEEIACVVEDCGDV